jgi:sulfofructose kinase
MKRDVVSQLASLVFAGVAALDTIALVARMPGYDERVAAEELIQAGGGPAATAAVTVSRLGLPAAFVGAVGDDENGDRILAGLSRENVDVSGAVRVAGARSAASLGLVDRGRRSRALISRPGPCLRIGRSGPASELLAAAEWVHVDHAGWAAVAAWRPAARFRLSVDAGNPIPGFSPEGVDLYGPTLAALQARYGNRPAPALLGAALAEGASCVVATRGGEGAIAASRDTEPTVVAALPGEVVSTLGAGDVFHGALLAATVYGMPLRERLAYASTAAGLSCRALDGRSGIPSHAETLTAASAVKVIHHA